MLQAQDFAVQYTGVTLESSEYFRGTGGFTSVSQIATKAGGSTVALLLCEPSVQQFPL